MSCCTPRIVSLELAQTRAAMCSACFLRPCGMSNAEMIAAAGFRGADLERPDACPRGWWPDPRCRVTWAGAAHSGTPMLLRWWLWCKGVLSRPGALAGCGCVRELKAFALRVKRWQRC